MTAVHPWLTAGVKEVLLPSGYRLRGVIQSGRSLARRGKLPAHLFEAAEHLGDREWSEDPEHRALVLEYVRLLIASFPRESMAPGSDTWKSMTMTPDDIETMDDLDVDLLEDLVLHLKTPEEVTVASEKILKLEAEEAGDEQLPNPPGEQATEATEGNPDEETT